MLLILIVTIVLAVSSTLAWVGFRWVFGLARRDSAPVALDQIGSMAVAAAWLVGDSCSAVLVTTAAPASRGARWDVARGLSPAALPDIPPHHRRRPAALAHRHPGLPVWEPIGCSAISWTGCPVYLRSPAGIGDVTTGLLAAFVAYAWYSGKPYARTAAIAWNIFGMADLVNAEVLEQWPTVARRHSLPACAHPRLWSAALASDSIRIH